MGVCETCRNYYDKTIIVTVDGAEHEFDCFECAIHALAPVCQHCGVRIIGHGMETASQIYCCANCAKAEGRHGLHDRYPDPDESRLV